MADTPKKGGSGRGRQAQSHQANVQPQQRTAGGSGAQRPSRNSRGAGGEAAAHTPPPRIHQHTTPHPGQQIMPYPQHLQHLQHPQYPQCSGLPVYGVPHPPPPPPPPAAFFPGSASLFEQLDKRVMVVLRDGRHLVGVMRSYDQFSNIVLEDTHERHFVGDIFGDVALGLFLVRGDAIVLMGELDSTLEETPRFKRVSADEIIEAQRGTSAEQRQDAKLDWLFQDLS